MLYTLGPGPMAETVARAIGVQASPAHVGAPRFLESAYRAFLVASQGLPMPPAPGVRFVTDARLEQQFITFIDADSPLNDYARYRDGAFLRPREGSDTTRDAEVHALEKRVTGFYARDQEFWSWWRLLINHVVCVRSPYTTRGGTTSGALGVIYTTRHAELSDTDLYEFFVHEMTHHAVFLFELAHGLYHYEAIRRPENHAPTALSRKLRPLDKVLHSIVVATEIIHHRLRARALPARPPFHGTTEAIVEGTLASIQAVEARPDLDRVLTEGGRWLLGWCHQSLRDLGAHHLAPVTAAPRSPPTRVSNAVCPRN